MSDADGADTSGTGSSAAPGTSGATAGASYAERLRRLESARWKLVLDVQRPYRWNMRRLARGRVLDVGCGIGRNLLALEDAVGVDHNTASVHTARERGLTAWDTTEWPTSRDAVPESFDTMLLSHVLEHLQRDQADALLRAYLPFLRPSARLVLICPQEKGYSIDETHVRFVDRSELERTARSVGFVITQFRSFPFPARVGRVFPYNEFVLVADRAT